MSLYLCIYAGDREVDGVEVGPYANFNALRTAAVGVSAPNAANASYPTLLEHSDCDGEWSPDACVHLHQELASLVTALKNQPPTGFPSEWQQEMARSVGLEPRNAFECFIDVDGEFLLDRLQHLVDTAVRLQLPILFQ